MPVPALSQLAVSVAPLDRRVQLLTKLPADAAPVLRVSDLRTRSHVVLLGEPGMGKSTVLAREAAAAGWRVLTVRAFVHGAAAAGVPLFLDGLDEYRSDRDAAADKAEMLATRLCELATPGWWLTCRAEDWSDADRLALARAAGEQGITVARLEPLDSTEVEQILACVAGPDAEAALARTGNLAARAFLENPLSLTLLVKAVQDINAWPATRFALFDGATRRLVHEHNQLRRPNAPRETPNSILAAAGHICALLLLSNSGALWRSNAPAPTNVGAKGLLPTNALALTTRQVADTLDTALFRQEEDAVFLPMHRAVAEYLAGHALAVAVAGGPGKPRYPLGRALSLIAGANGRAPTELRGVYAWTAVHLSQLGRHEDAERMIRQDAVSVLIYGDAAVLTTAERRTLLANLDRDDPWFRSAEEGDTAVGGLAGDDLAPEFGAILQASDDGTHHFLTVAEALTYGGAVPSLLPLLREIALAPTRPTWRRQRAAEAWITGACDRVAARLALYRAASALPQAEGTVTLRVALAGKLPVEQLTDGELDQLLVDHYRMADQNTVGRLWSLTRRLQALPRPALLERAWGELFAHRPASGARIEIERLLDANLATLLRASPAPNGGEVWRWLTKRHRFPTERVGEEVRAALRDWLNADPQHEVTLFEAIAGTGTDSPRWPTIIYLYKCGVLPSLAVVTALLDDGSGLRARYGEERCLSMAVGLTSFNDVNADCFWTVFECLQAQPAGPFIDALVAELGTRTIDENQQAAAWQAAAQREEDEREISALRAEFRQRAPELAAATAIDLLDDAADLRFGHDVFGRSAQPGFERVEELFGHPCATAVATGWQHLAAQGNGIEPEQLGEAEARHSSLVGEKSILAGIDLHLTTPSGSPSTLPWISALIVLRSVWQADNDKPASARLVQWALDCLAVAGAEASRVLLAMWNGALSAGLQSALPGMWLLKEHSAAAGFAAPALGDLLRARPDMPTQALDSTLDAAVRIVPREELLELAQRALDREPPGESFEAWLCIAFALDPAEHRSQFASYFREHPAQFKDHYPRMRELAEPLATYRILFADTLFRVFGPGREPGEALSWSSDPVIGSLAWLQGSHDPLARLALEGLVNEPNLLRWRDSIRHALAKQAKMHLDRSFVPGSVPAIQAALSGGPPVNAADLWAVVVDQLRQIQGEMQADSSMPWQAYWNEASNRNRASPKVENSCRNVLAQQLKVRLTPFGISIPPMPEAQRAAETRVDLLIQSGAGANLPIEAKRHFHPKVWKAAATQLQGYAVDPGAGGLGILLVFWFGDSWTQTPSRGRGKPKPGTANEMERMLREDLPVGLRETTEIVVMDVSDPRAANSSATTKPAPKRSAAHGAIRRIAATPAGRGPSTTRPKRAA